MKTVRGGRERLWELRFAPLRVLVPVVCAVLLGFAALTGFNEFGAALAVGCLPGAVLGIVLERGRYGGRARMRQFYGALRARQLPTLATADEAVHWHRLIVGERTRRRAGLAMSWFLPVISAFCVIYDIIVVPEGPSSSGRTLPVLAVLLLAVFAWTRYVTPRILVALDVLAQQGAERGYGYWLTTTWPAAH
ncbi:hypothetical protein [Nocardia sp. CC201C]|uniref:hypothetical protein n=1 Tax=Nocardia sp. CC201C TaxID=3044575 RepID=UPI0024A93695|nr:hypothetical protein [Nocardia sp. CC201C]